MVRINGCKFRVDEMLIRSRHVRRPLLLDRPVHRRRTGQGRGQIRHHRCEPILSLGNDYSVLGTVSFFVWFAFFCLGIGAIMVGMTIVSIFLMDRAGRRTLHLWGLGGMFIFSIFITISLLVKVIPFIDRSK